MTNAEVADLVDYDGLEWAIENWDFADDIKDRHLRSLWKTAARTIEEIRDILESATETDDD